MSFGMFVAFQAYCASFGFLILVGAMRKPLEIGDAEDAKELTFSEIYAD